MRRNRFVYTPYGESQTLTASWTTPAVGSSPATPWAQLFQGLKFTDVTGLAYVRHRDYSATLGRFIEVDPIGFEAGDNNWYRFVANGPTGNVDPSGLWAWDDDWMQMGAGGLLGFYGTGVAADGWSSNTNVAIHKDIHAQAAAAREKAWRGYREATNPVDAGANLLFGVGLNAVGEGFAHGGLGIAEIVPLGGLRGSRCAAPSNPGGFSHPVSTPQSARSVGDILAGTTLGRITKGKTTLHINKGGITQANADFDALRPTSVKPIDTRYGPGRTGTLTRWQDDQREVR